MVRNHAGLLDGCDHLLHPGTTMTTTTPTPTRSSAVPALALAVVATLPYLALKGLWLSGSSVGLTPEAAAEMHTGRFLIGNSVTVVLEILALVLAWSLTRPWAARVPTRLFALLAAGASGLLAPILLGLPLGQVAQTVVHGSPSFEGEGMAPWVFACVYGGFVLLGVALAWSIVDHARERWGAFFSTPPSATRPWPLVAGAVGLAPFGLAMLWWGATGPGALGPQGMESPVQRTVLVVTGVLSLAALVTPVLTRLLGTIRRTGPGRAQLAWLVVWGGCCTAALQGPTQLLLAHGGEVQPAIAAIALLATPGAALHGLGLLAAHRQTGGGGCPAGG